MDRGFFPLDEELKLLPGRLTPFGHECLARLAGWMPFEKAEEILADFMGIAVSESLGRRYAEAAGAADVRIQSEEVEQIEREAPIAPKGADKLQISADGAMVPLVHGKWAEVRTLVVGEVQPAVKEKEAWVIHTRNLSYFSRKMNAQEFGRLALMEPIGSKALPIIIVQMRCASSIFRMPPSISVPSGSFYGERIHQKQGNGSKNGSTNSSMTVRLACWLNFANCKNNTRMPKPCRPICLTSRNALPKCSIQPFKPKAGRLVAAWLKAGIN